MNIFRLFFSFTGISVAVSFIMMSLSYYFSVTMSKENFGLFSYLQSIYMVLLNFVPFGAGMAVVTFRYSVDALSYRKLISSFFWPVIPLSFLASLGIVFIIGMLGSVKDVVLITLVAVLALNNTIIVLALNHMRVEQKVKSLAIFHVSSTAVLVLSFITSYSIYNKLFYAYLAACLGSAIFSLMAFKYLHRNIGFSFDGFKFFPVLRARFNYGLLVVVSSVLMSFMALSDKLILANLIPYQEFGEYAVVSLIASSTLFLVNSFASTWASYLNGKLQSMSVRDRKSLLKHCEGKIILALFFSMPLIACQIAIYYIFYENNVYVFSLAALSIGFYIYGISKIYMGFLNAYHRNGLVVLSTFFGLLLTFVILLVYQGDDYELIMPLALVLGYCVQLGFCKLFTERVLRVNFSST